MGGRAWSQEELIRLEELTEIYPLATVARKLNRSENAVFLKRQRTGIGGFMANTDMLTRNTLSRILGVEKRKNDISHKYNWTQTEVSQMKMLRKQGFTIREIAEKMNRSESSIKYKLYGREKSNGRS